MNYSCRVKSGEIYLYFPWLRHRKLKMLSCKNLHRTLWSQNCAAHRATNGTSGVVGRLVKHKAYKTKIASKNYAKCWSFQKLIRNVHEYTHKQTCLFGEFLRSQAASTCYLPYSKLRPAPKSVVALRNMAKHHPTWRGTRHARQKNGQVF